MRWALKIAISLLGAILTLYLVGFLLPSAGHIDRSILVDSPQEQVFTIINDLTTRPDWSPWFEIDPSVEVIYSDPPFGKDAWCAWSANAIKSGKMTIIKAELDQLKMLAEIEVRGVSIATFDLEQTQSGQTKVIWSYDKEFGNDIIARWIGLSLDYVLGPDYERGLKNLKTLSESKNLMSNY